MGIERDTLQRAWEDLECKQQLLSVKRFNFFLCYFLKFLWMWITCANQNKTNWWLIKQTSEVRDCAAEGTELNGRVSGSSSTQSGEHRQHFLWKQTRVPPRTPGTRSPYNSQHLPTLHHYFPTPPPSQLWAPEGQEAVLFIYILSKWHRTWPQNDSP